MALDKKDTVHCLICNSKCGVSTRNCVRIFSDTAVTPSDKPLSQILSSVLQIDVNESNVHSLVICKKCYKLFTEVDELETRLTEVRLEIFSNYQKTIKKVAECTQVENEEIIEDYNDHDYLDSQITQNADIDEECKNEIEDKKEEIVEEITVQTTEKNSPEEIVEPHGTKEEENEEITEKCGSPKKKSGKKIKSVNIKTEPPAENIEYVAKEGNMYTCLLCSNEEERTMGDAKTITAHVKNLHDYRLYICDICGDDFKKRNELSIHLDEHVAKEEGDFQCEVCNRIFSNLRLFRIHKRIHYPQVKMWPCDTCGKRYSSKNLLDEHINTHTGVRPHICKTCGKDFASKYTYRAHTKTHEVRPRPFECQQCNKSFLSHQNLIQHEKTHNGVKEYVCHQCGKAFGSPHNLEVHNIVHSGFKPYICRVCGKAFARKAEITDHERTHTGERPYQCEFCGATFSQRSNLQSHKRATHYNDKRYKCNDCGKGFKRRRLLDYHIKAAHTGERPYKCEICSATFVYPEHFKKHMRIHTGEKPYLCEVCGKAFNSRDNRNAHRFIHSDKKPYECLVCGMGFMRKPLLYTHMQTQGHINDTIVVNQPRLTTEEEETIVEGDVQLLMEGNGNDQLEETELYVTELKDHVIIQQADDETMYNEEAVLDIPDGENVATEEVDDLGVGGQINFCDTDVLECKPKDSVHVEEVYTYDNEEGEAILVPNTGELDENAKNAVRIVQIRIPSSAAGGNGRSWYSLVQNT